MTTTTKLLGVSLAGIVAGLLFVTGIVNVQAVVAFYIALPLGAVFFGLFLISKMLEREVGLYDAEQQAKLAFQQVAATKLPAAARACAVPTNAHASSVH
jgi:hypothetical protein